MDNFVTGLKTAIKQEKEFQAQNGKDGTFSQLLKYEPGFPNAGIFPPNKIWYRDSLVVG